MNSVLDQTADLAGRAAEANWCVKTLASQCGVSPSTLERHIKKRYGLLAKDWMRQVRLQRTLPALEEKLGLKVAAGQGGYANPHHFSREFKKCFGYPPSQHAA